MTAEVEVTDEDRRICAAVGQQVSSEMGAYMIATHRHNSTEALRAQLEEAYALLREEIAANKAVNCPIDRPGGTKHDVCPECRATSSMICKRKAEAAFGTVRRIDTLTGETT